MKLAQGTYFVITLAIVGSLLQQADAARFINLGDLNVPGNDFSATSDVSADGRVVVGYVGPAATQEGKQAFRWTEQTGMVGLGQLSGSQYSFATAVSGEGSLVVGYSAARSFTWTQSNGMVLLPAPSSNSFSIAYDVSADGSVIVGHSYSGNFFPISWTKSSGTFGQWQRILIPILNVNGASIEATSADGSVVVGHLILQPSSGIYEAFRKSPTGITRLGDLPGGIFFSLASDVSADGSVVVGTGHTNGHQHAFRWTEQTGMVGLDDLSDPSNASGAAAVSADGSVVVGSHSLLDAFRWTQSRGIESIFQLLADDGLDVAGWSQTRAISVSADGNIIAGDGRDPNGQYHAWWADLTIPEPPSQFLAALALLTWGRVRRKH